MFRRKIISSDTIYYNTMASNDMNFQVDIDNYLSFQFDAHKNKMLALSLSKPAEYSELRAKIVAKLRDDNVRSIYKTLMGFMTAGHESATSTVPISTDVVPGYPRQEALKFCLSSSETLNKIFSDCVDICLPPPYSKVALQRDSDLGKAMSSLA